MIVSTQLLFAEGPTSPLGGLAGMWPVLLMLAVFYFLVLRPMSKQENERKERINSIKKGDKVVLTGGILGRVSRVDGDVAIIEIADKVKIRVLKKDIADFEDNALGNKDGDDKDGKDKDGKDKDDKDQDDGDKASRKAG